jgi:hypothetical protein
MLGLLQSQSNRRQDVSCSQFLSQNKPDPSKDHDIVRLTSLYIRKGTRLFVKAVVQGPVDVLVNLMRGLHNIPKALGRRHCASFTTS